MKRCLWIGLQWRQRSSYSINSLSTNLISFFFPFGHANSMRKFPGQGSNSHHSCKLCHSCKLHHSCTNARSLTHYNRPVWDQSCATIEPTPYLKPLYHSGNSNLILFCFVLFFRAAPAVYGGSQARGQIEATAAGPHHSQSNAGSEPCLWPTQQPTAMPDP